MPKKIKCPSCSPGWCSNHLLELNPTGKNTYHRKKIRVRLCPKISKTQQIHKSIPIFNRDNKCYTPCFLLSQELSYYSQNDEKLRSSHENKALFETPDDQPILIAKHGRNKNYCSVCRCEYEDYMQHMDDESHRKCLRGNKFTGFIDEMEKQLQEERAKAAFTELKNKELFKIPQETADIDLSCTKISSFPSKFEDIALIQ